MFNEQHKKESPILGLLGLGGGIARGGGSGVEVTGGDATFTYNGKQIHVFTSSGSLVR